MHIKFYPFKAKISKKVFLKVAHIHTGFDDRCLFWYNGYTGQLKDLFFIRIS